MDVSGFYENLRESVEYAEGDGVALILWLVSLLYLWLFVPRMRRELLAVCLIVLALVNPISGGLALYVVEWSQPYSRFVWILFPEILTVAAVCHMTLRQKRAWLRWLIGAACAVALIAGGRLITTTELFDKPQNEYQISEEAQEVADYLFALQEEENAKRNMFSEKKAARSKLTRAVVAEALLPEMRQVHSGLHLYYGRRAKRANMIETRLADSDNAERTEAYFAKLDRAHVTAIVLPTEVYAPELLERYGWSSDRQIGGYTVYLRKP